MLIIKLAKNRPILKTLLSIIIIISFGSAYASHDNREDAIEIEVLPDIFANEYFYGFGAETLPWLWTKENRDSGVNDEDIRLNLERIKDMRLAITRIFVPWETWNPSADYITFTWESDEMLSLYKTLDLYQEMGAKVILVTADWLEEPPWTKTEASAAAVLELLEHLITEKGYSCIRFWTLTNEPELTYGWLKKMPFENYAEIHRLVKKGLRRKGLSVKIIASDEVESSEWFEKSIRSLYGTADIFSSHAYFYPDKTHLIPDFFKERIGALEKASLTKEDIPFFLCEFGFRGPDFSTRHNSFMQDYEYGLLVADLACEVLNTGVSSASIWCLHQIRLIDEIDVEGGKMMRIGLWGFKDEDWQPFPVFYLYRLLTKFIRPGSRVLGVKGPFPDGLKFACVSYNGRYSLFIVNLTNETKKFLVDGLGLGLRMKKFIYSESDYRLKAISSIVLKEYLKDEILPRSAILFTELDEEI